MRAAAALRTVVALGAAALGAGPALAQPPVPDTATFACGGSVEAEAWRRWDEAGAPFVKQELIGARLKGQGDTYALYDFEIIFHNLLAMAQRCGRIDRQLELARLVRSTYDQLVPATENQPGRAWVCRGGVQCTPGSGLVGTEVILFSVQYMAFAVDLANGLLAANAGAEARAFAVDTARIAREHMVRFTSSYDRRMLRQRIAAKPEDVKDGSSHLFLDDRELWKIAVLSDLAGLWSALPELSTDANPNDAAFIGMKQALGLLLRFVAVRTSNLNVRAPDGSTVQVADLDRGFWRLFADSRYAGYDGATKPVICRPDPARGGQVVPVVQTPVESVPVVPTVGWDISHARRFVHFNAAVDRNRDALVKVFNVSAASLPPRGNVGAFARQLRTQIWNQDIARPLFANYYAGVNGWYRVAYDNGSGACVEGFAPFGLSDSFPTGGYAMWGTVDAPLTDIARRLFYLTRSRDTSDQAFIRNYYRDFSLDPGSSDRMIAEMMFWPSLVNTGTGTRTGLGVASAAGTGPNAAVKASITTASSSAPATCTATPQSRPCAR